MMTWIKWIGLLSVLLCLVFFIRTTDFAAVVDLLRKIGGSFFYLLLVTFAAYVFGTLSWWYCLGKYRNSVSFHRLFLVRHIGETLSLINPASIIAGETAKVYLLKNSGIDRPVMIASILISRIVLMVSQLILLIFMLIPFLYTENLIVVKWSSLWVLICLFVLISILLLAYKKAKKTNAILQLRQRFIAVASAWRELTTYSKRATIMAFGFSILHWIFGALEFYLIIRFLGFNVSIFRGVLVDLGVVLFKAAGAFIPGQLGVEEYGNKTMIAAIGIQSATLWVAASILRRSRQLFWIAIGCGAWLLLQCAAKLSDKKRNGDFIYKS